MNINRNNYEEFFLLYVDNELSATQKNAVEDFVKENLDLQEELLMLKQSILVPEPINFSGKESLFRAESIEGSVQQELLLLLDNELDKVASEKMLILAGSDATVKKEWELLLQTRLDKADTITFSDKNSLYKKQTTPVLPIRWRAMAAAAVIIGLAVWSIQSYFEKTGSQIKIETATTQPSKTGKNLGNSTKDQPLVAVNQLTAVRSAAGHGTGSVTGQLPLSPSKQPIKQLASKLQQQKIDRQAGPDMVSIPDSHKKRLPKMMTENNNATNSNILNVSTVSPTALSNINMNNAVSNTSVNESALSKETAAANQFAVQTLDTEPENNAEEDENNAVKSKLGGFFKKIKRVVERKTNMQSGERSIKIANMSFAVK